MDDLATVVVASSEDDVVTTTCSVALDLRGELEKGTLTLSTSKSISCCSNFYNNALPHQKGCNSTERAVMGELHWKACMKNSLEGGKEELKCCFDLFPFLGCRREEDVLAFRGRGLPLQAS